MQRKIIVLAALGALGSFTGWIPSLASEHVVGHIEISALELGKLGNSNYIGILISNNSRRSVCIRKRIIEDPLNTDINIRLRHPSGDELKQKDPGYLPPTDPRSVVVPPRSKIHSIYYLDDRFSYNSLTGVLHGVQQARVSFFVSNCSNQMKLLDSGWLPLTDNVSAES